MEKTITRGIGQSKWIVGIVLVLWIVVSVLAFNVFLVINAVLGVAAIAVLFVKKLRLKLPQQMNSFMRLMAVVGDIGCWLLRLKLREEFCSRKR